MQHQKVLPMARGILKINGRPVVNIKRLKLRMSQKRAI